MRFDVAARLTKAEATLRDGTTKQMVEIPGGIRFQSVEMKPLPVRGTTYSAEYDAAFTAEPTFEWRSKAGEFLKFSPKAPSLDSFFFDQPVLSVQRAATLQWAGEPLGKGETLVLMWENAAEGKTVPMEVATNLGAARIEMPAAKIAQVGAGDWSLYLVRRRLTKAEVGDFQVESVAEFYTKPMRVKVGK